MPEDKGIWTGTYESAFAKSVAAAVVPEPLPTMLAAGTGSSLA